MINKYLQDTFFGVLGAVFLLMLFAVLLKRSEIPEQKILIAQFNYDQDSSVNNKNQDHLSKSFLSFGYNNKYINSFSEGPLVRSFYNINRDENQSNTSVLYLADTTNINSTIQISSENLLSFRKLGTDIRDSVRLSFGLIVGDKENHDALSLNIPLTRLIEVQDSMALSNGSSIISLFELRIIKSPEELYFLEVI